MIGLPSNVRRIEDVIRANPQLASYAKYANDRFKQLNFVVFSQPQTHPYITIYGLFQIDRQNVLENLTNTTYKDEVVQDFIALNRKTGRIIYYSGRGAKTGSHQNITSFCTVFGRNLNGDWGEYGCTSNRHTTNHRYRDENDPNLPDEPWIRAQIKNELAILKEKVKDSRAN